MLIGRLPVNELAHNEVLMDILTRAAKLDLPGWYLTAGSVFQTVWNVVTDRPPTEGIKYSPSVVNPPMPARHTSRPDSAQTSPPATRETCSTASAMRDMSKREGGVPPTNSRLEPKPGPGFGCPMGPARARLYSSSRSTPARHNAARRFSSARNTLDITRTGGPG